LLLEGGLAISYAGPSDIALRYVGRRLVEPTSTSRLLSGLPADEKRRAAAILETCPRLDIGADGSRRKDSLPEATLLFVEEGLLLILTLRSGAGRRIVVGLAGAGAVLVPPTPHEELKALADSSLTIVPPAAHEALLAVPGAAAAVVEGIADQLRERQESLGQLSTVRHAERVRSKLIQLARTHGKVVTDGVRIGIPLTQRLLAEMVGSARETVSLALAQLAREGFVRREGHCYVLAVRPTDLSPE
jgi:CRP-like cAMP-binding protein